MTAGALIQCADVLGQSQVTDVADVVIIGSGAAGATAARVLSDAGVDVIIIEEGADFPAQSLRGDIYSGFRHAWRDMGFQVAEGRAFVPILQGCCVGGTTPMNGAIIHRIPEPIHQVWCNEYGVGDEIPYDVLSRIWDQMDEELGVCVTPDDVLGRNNSLMRDGTEATGIVGNAIRRSVRGCKGRARCLQGCPTDQKQSMNVTYVPRSIEAGARLYAECRADELLISAGRASGVVGQFVERATGTKGPKLRVEARHAVLVAASAIQTPLLLARNGIGNTSKLVGKRLQAHPGTSVLGLFDEPVNMWFGATQGYESTHYWDQRMKFEVVSTPLPVGAARLPGLGPELIARIADFGHVAQWGLQVRCRAQGNVRRGFGGRTVISYCPSSEDVATFKRGVRLLAEMMFATGAHTVFPGTHGLPVSITSADELAAMDDLRDDPRLFHYIAAHLFGTAVMGRDPASSVVGFDCQSHEVNGLYVTDSSVFPTNLGVNPQHAIAGISWLAAERLANRLI